jgi:hypothetical protein
MVKNAVFWNITKCDSCNNRRFGETYRLHYQGDKNRRGRNNVSSNYQPKHPKDGGNMFLRIRPFLHESQDVTSQKTAFFIATAVKTKNVTQH